MRLLISIGLLLLFGLCACENTHSKELKLNFIGDSQVRNWDTDLWFNYAETNNHGIPGQKATDLINITSSYSGLENKILLIGINDLLAMDFETPDASEAFSNLQECFENIITYFVSDGSLMVITVLPLSEEESAIRGEGINQHVVLLNDFLRMTCGQAGAKFVDAAKTLAPQGHLTERFTLDGLHLNNEGYEILSKAIRLYYY